MKRYLTLTRSVFMTVVTYRFGFLFTFVGNLLYLVLVYFLWRGIYQGAETIRGMTLDQALVYLALASSIFVLLKTWTEWFMSRMVRDGSIAMELIKDTFQKAVEQRPDHPCSHRLDAYALVILGRPQCCKKRRAETRKSL